jgi:hypothetical protein
MPGKLAEKLGADVPNLVQVAPGECKELYLAMFLMLSVLSLSKRLLDWETAASSCQVVADSPPRRGQRAA